MAQDIDADAAQEKDKVKTAPEKEADDKEELTMRDKEESSLKRES